MLKPWGSKRKGEEVFIDVETNADAPETTQESEKSAHISAFFLNRSIGWFAMAVAILAFTIIFVKSVDGTSGLIMAAIAVAMLCIVRIHMLSVGKRKQYFTLRLTCIDARTTNFIENLPSFINPTSNSAFRGSQQVAFLTNSGTKVIFTYERNRKFLVGTRYDFYFNMPPKQGDGKITVDMLEGLRIDHALVQDEIVGADIMNDVNLGSALDSKNEELI